MAIMFGGEEIAGAFKGDPGDIGPFAFHIDANGHLIMDYEGNTAPDASIDNNGHLILSLNGQSSDVGKITDPTFSKWRANKNYLDNWYFVGGGSQKLISNAWRRICFPINQRGQTTSPKAEAYFIDRWANNNQGQIELTDNGLDISSDASCGIYQNVPIFGFLGRTVTFSALREHTLKSVTITLPSVYSGSWERLIEQYGLIIDMLGSNRFRVQVQNSSYNELLLAVKLEFGTEQTLCHNEGTDANPVWVLNELPNFAEELLKCQRTFQVFRSYSARPDYGCDARPPMVSDSPATGTITIDGVTYYTLTANI